MSKNGSKARLPSASAGGAGSGRTARKSTSSAAAATRPSRPPSLTVSRPELLVNGSDREFRRLVHALLGFLATHETIRAGHARTIGLAGVEYTVLISIAHLSQDANVNVSTIAAHLHLSGAFITTVCQRLQALGLIAKGLDPNDRRRVTLTVSDQGRALLDRLAPTQRDVNDAEFACLSRTEFLLLLDMIERLIESGDRAVVLQRYLTMSSPPSETAAQGLG